MVMNPVNWATLMTDFIQSEQFFTTPKSIYTRDNLVNTGFRAIRVLDTPVFLDPFCPLGEAYMINSRYLSLYMSEYAPMTFSGFESQIPVGQISDIGVLISASDLCCAKPSSGAHLTGITGAAAPDAGRVTQAVARIKRHTGLPVAVGFGVRDAASAASIARGADAVVVGSALVERVRTSLDAGGKATPDTVRAVTSLVAELAAGVRDGRRQAAE